MEYALGAPGCLGLVPVFSHRKQIRLTIKNTTPNPHLMNHAHTINHTVSFTARYRYGCRALNCNGRLCCMCSDACEKSSQSRDRQFESDETMWLRVVDVFSFSCVTTHTHSFISCISRAELNTIIGFLSACLCVIWCIVSKAIIQKSTLDDSPRNLVFSCQRSW